MLLRFGTGKTLVGLLTRRSEVGYLKGLNPFNPSDSGLSNGVFRKTVDNQVTPESTTWVPPEPVGLETLGHRVRRSLSSPPYPRGLCWGTSRTCELGGET